MASDPERTRIKWEGDSKRVIQTFPEEVRQNLGADLSRLENKEEPLDFKYMGSKLPGVYELRDSWFRLFYALLEGWVYVLHCFEKKTAQTSEHDIKLGRTRLAAVDARIEAIRGRRRKSA